MSGELEMSPEGRPLRMLRNELIQHDKEKDRQAVEAFLVLDAELSEEWSELGPTGLRSPSGR